METSEPEQKNPQDLAREVKAKKDAAKYLVVEMATEFAFLIAIPLISFVYLGKRLDQRYHVKFYALIGVFLALSVSITAISKRINQIRKRLK